MKIITVFCTSRPGAENELIALCTGMIEPSRKEPGCIRYSFYRDLRRPEQFFFYEEWADQGSIDAHNRSRHYTEFRPKFIALIEGDPLVTVHTVQ